MTTTPVHSITDEQIADSERLMAELERVAGNLPSVRALITRLREAEKDAARMEWLANAGDLIVNLERWKDLENGQHYQSAGLSLSNGKLYAGKTLREAIDTAMQGDK